jgi:hypothetical protein
VREEVISLEEKGAHTSKNKVETEITYSDSKKILLRIIKPAQQVITKDTEE